MADYAEPDLTPVDLGRLRRFLAPAQQLQLHPLIGLRCQAEARLRQDGQLLARVAPWLLTARLRTDG